MTAAASFSTGLAHSLPVLLCSRLLLGAGTSCAIAGSGAYMADITKTRPDQRAKIMGAQLKHKSAFLFIAACIIVYASVVARA